MVLIFSYWWSVLASFIYPLFVHVAHIVAGYLLAKGKKIGVFVGIVIGIFEIVPFLTVGINDILAEPVTGISFRILFAIVIFLIVTGRKELANLQSENWRPWKNPLIKSQKII